MNKVTIMGLLSCMILSSTVFAQVRPGYGRENSLDTRVADLEYKLEQTNRRLERLERDLSNPRPPQYEMREDVSCLIIDSYYNKTFLANGRTKLEAEANVRQTCTSGSNNMGSACTGVVKCSSGVKNPSVRGFICVVTDTYYNKTFKAEGKNEIEAEAKTRQACTTGSNNMGSACSAAKINCEAF